jgi:hypothetical protein
MTEEFCFDECKHCLLMILLVVTSPAKAAQEMFLDRLQTHCVRSHISLAKKLATKAEGRGAWIPCNSQMPWKECEGINFFTECKMCGGLSMAETITCDCAASKNSTVATQTSWLPNFKIVDVDWLPGLCTYGSS